MFSRYGSNCFLWRFLKAQKEQFATYRRIFHGDTKDIFQQPVSAAAQLPQRRPVDTAGPTPFPGATNAASAALSAMLNRSQQPHGMFRRNNRRKSLLLVSLGQTCRRILSTLSFLVAVVNTTPRHTPLIPYLTGKSSESSTVGPREPWLDLGSRPGRFGEL